MRHKDAAVLTAREREVLVLLASGLRTAQIAHELRVAKVTVELHARNARRKLGALTREHAVALALVHGVIGSLVPSSPSPDPGTTPPHDGPAPRDGAQGARLV